VTGVQTCALPIYGKARLQVLLKSLKDRGLVFAYGSAEGISWAAHPFLRDRFRQLLGCPPERVFAVVANALGANLEKRPATKPSEPAELDRYEQLIEATRLAGREWEAFELYSDGLGGYGNLARVLGEYGRGYRIVSGFSSSGQPKDLALTLHSDTRGFLVNALSLFALRLGRLEEARALRQVEVELTQSHTQSLLNSSSVLFACGHLSEALKLASLALKSAEAGQDFYEKQMSLCRRAYVSHALGKVDAAEADFAAATKVGGGNHPLVNCAQEARHRLDLGDLAGAHALAVYGLEGAKREKTNYYIPLFLQLHARLALAVDIDSTGYLEEIRAWTARTGEMEWIITAHLLTARQVLGFGDSQAALAEVENGLLHAESCGYRLLRIELLIALARIRLAWPNSPAAIQAARLALDLATAPECSYAWGQADAFQVWGEAYAANNEPSLARRAFQRAIAVRKHIRHPGVEETKAWLALAS
jgi:tetratricopeptide (TPR) repeat protein